MATIQVRDVRDEDYEAIRDAAKAEGKSLQAFMQEQMSVIARRVRKQTALNAVRETLSRDPGPGLTASQIVAELDAIRGPRPHQEDLRR